MNRVIYAIRKPRRCQRCGGNIYRILYGEPCCDEQEYFERFGEHVVFGGCCISDNDPVWACKECGTPYYKLTFPRNAKAIAREALLKEEHEQYCDVEYLGIYKKMMTYRAVVAEGFCTDGYDLVFVKENGKTKRMTGVVILNVEETIRKGKK